MKLTTIELTGNTIDHVTDPDVMPVLRQMSWFFSLQPMNYVVSTNQRYSLTIAELMFNLYLLRKKTLVPSNSVKRFQTEIAFVHKKQLL